MSDNKETQCNMPSTSGLNRKEYDQEMINPFGDDFKNFRNCFQEYTDHICRNSEVLEELHILFEKLSDNNAFVDRSNDWIEDEHSIILLPEHVAMYKAKLENFNNFMGTNWKYLTKLRNLFNTLECEGKPVRIPKTPLLTVTAKKMEPTVIKTEQPTLPIETQIRSKPITKCKILIEIPSEAFLCKKKFSIHYG